MTNGQTLAIGNLRAPLSERGNDLYETPPEAVRALLSVEDVPHKVWEPACGPGAIVRELRASGRDVWATDLVEYSSPDQDEARLDFLLPWTGYADRAIVTNPPFKLAQEFVEKSLDRAPYVAMLLRLAFIESERRTSILDNGKLSRVHVFKKRLPMMHREGFAGKKTTSSGMPFAWFVWDKNHNGACELTRISY